MSFNVSIVTAKDHKSELAEHDKAFEDLNREWLEAYFYVEPCDKEIFGNIFEKILKPGGILAFVSDDEEIVGCGALISMDGNGYELAKMAVTKSHRGHGIGRLVMERLLEFAKTSGADFVELITNSDLIPAIKLYETGGFVKTHEGPHPVYVRGDVVMRLEL